MGGLEDAGVKWGEEGWRVDWRVRVSHGVKRLGGLAACIMI